MTTKELSICLKDQRHLYPGDTIEGQIILDLKRSVDIQHISLNFYGSIEGCGDKIMLFNETQLLATPKEKQNYTVFGTGKVHEFDFSFLIPKDRRLPSTVNISKFGKISYMLTATHKKPRFKLSPNLTSASKEIKILDKIDINSPDYQSPVKASDDIGFICGSKLTQWSINIPQSAFAQGDSIPVDCQINNFPTMRRSKAVKISLIRQIHKTSSGKVLEDKTLSFKFIDLNIGDSHSASQSLKCNLNIPTNTPPNIFPDTGRVLSVSYVIRADLNMKEVKSAIKIKPFYEQQVSVVIGTYSSSYNQQMSINSNSMLSTHCKDSSYYATLKILLPLNHSWSPAPSYSIPIGNFYQNDEGPNAPLPPIREASGMGSVTHISPLSKLEMFPGYQRPKSYVPLKPKTLSEQTFSQPSLTSRFSSDSSLQSSGLLETPNSQSALSFTPSLTPGSFQKEFLEFTPRLIQKRHSFSHKSVSPVDRALTPLPPLPPMPPISSVEAPFGYLTYRKTKSKTAKNNPPVPIIHSVPHEIGPDDIITVTKSFVPQDKVLDGERQLSQQSCLPGLSRNDTVSSASTDNEEPMCDVAEKSFNIKPRRSVIVNHGVH